MFTPPADPPVVPSDPAHFPPGRWFADKRVSRLLVPFFAGLDAAAFAALDPGPPPAAGTQEAEAALGDIVEKQKGLSADPARLARIKKQDEEFPDLLEPYGFSNERMRVELPALWGLCWMAIEASRPVLMHFKEWYNYPRPDQLAKPGEIDPKVKVGHPAYPSGHTCQTYLAALALKQVVGADGADRDKRDAMFRIAEDVAVNREYAGVHYAFDTKGGRRLAVAMFPRLRSAFAELFFVADKDWRDRTARPPMGAPGFAGPDVTGSSYLGVQPGLRLTY